MKRKLRCLLLILFCLWTLALPAAAASSLYHTPAMTVLTVNAPRDLEIMIRLQRKEGEPVPIFLEKKTRVWEQQFRLYREAGYSIRAWYGNSYDLEDAELVLRSSQGERVLLMPRELTDRMSIDDVLMLNYKTGTLELGMPLWRRLLPVILRVLMAVGLELLVFRLRGYRQLRSYLVAALGGLAAFALVGWYSSGWLNFDVRAIVPFLLMLFLGLTAQILLNLILVDEDARDHTLVTTLQGFALASVVTILFLYFLPI